MRRVRYMDGVTNDLRYAARMLRRSPSFTAIAIVTLALGIGANTAMFSVVNAVILRPLPYQDPDRLAMLWTTDPKRDIREEGTSYPTFLDWRSQSRAFADMAICSRGNPVTLTGGNEPERVMGEAVSANLFPLLGVTPLLGRTFSDDEEQQRERVVVVSYALWQRRFGASRDAIGKKLEVDGQTFQVIGVMPAGFYFPTKDVQLWQPATFVSMTLSPAIRDRIWTSRFSDWWRVVGRLRPTATFDDAQAEMTAIGQRLALAYPTTTDAGFAGFGVNVVPMLLQTTGRDLQRALWVLLGAVGFVLLIACTNVANLLLARGAARQREFALRAALGAGQVRLVRQLAVESALLVVGAAVVGLALALAGVRVLQAAAPPGIPRLDETQLDPRVLIFTASVSILGGLLFAIVPAWKTSRSDPADALKQGGRTGSEGLRLSRARRTFVVVECALAVALLAGAGLLLKSFVRVETVNPGFEAKQVLLVRINSARLSRELLDRIASLPGVQAVGAIRSFDPMNPDIAITAEGQPSLRAPLTSERVTAGFFQAMRVPLRTGRHFTEEDGRGMAIINETMAKTFWPREDPIGKRFKRGASESTSRWMTVIGVVGDMRRRGLERDAVSEFYEPEIEPSMELAIRTATDPLGHIASVRQVIRSFDGHVVIGRVTTVENHLEELGAARRFQTWLIAVFAGLGLVLSAIGIYGVMHYAVVQRTHEMGIRIALGAGGSHVLWLVIGEGLRLALIGVAAGLLAALQLTGVMARLLFEVSATDPAIFAIVPVMLTMVAVLACYLPARRASKVDPIVALRYE
jgi:putative ABC transport system permease protein